MSSGLDEALLILSAIIMISLVPLNAMTTAILYRIRKNDAASKVRALRERFLVSVVLLTASILGAVLALIRLWAVFVDPTVFANLPSVLVVTTIVILISVPGVMYVWGYFTDWFSDG